MIGEVASNGGLGAEEGLHASPNARAEFFGADAALRTAGNEVKAVFELSFGEADEPLSRTVVAFFDDSGRAGPFFLDRCEKTLANRGMKLAGDDTEVFCHKGGALMNLDFIESFDERFDLGEDCSSTCRGESCFY